MAAFNIKRLATVPGVLEASTMYITKNATNASLVDLTFVGTDVADVRRALGQADIGSAIDAAIAALTAEQIPDLPGSKITSAVASASKLETPRTITLAGSVTGSASFDGSSNITITTTGGGSTVTGFTGTATKVTYEDGVAKTNAGPLVAADIPDLPGSKITTAVALATALDVTAEW